MSAFNPNDVHGRAMESDDDDSDDENLMDSNNNRINEGTYTEVNNLFGDDLNKKSFYTDEFLDGNNVDSNEFSVQGIGRAAVSGDVRDDFYVHLYVNNTCFVTDYNVHVYVSCPV